MTDRTKRDDAAVALQYELTTILREGTGMHESFASPLAAVVVRGLRLRFRGERLYIADIDPAEREERDKAIRAEFNGQNLDEVCQKHGISKSRLYQIVGKRG